jgi:hypothetical protein
MTSRLGRFILNPILFLSLTASALSQDRMVLGPRQLEQDKGAGAVLCSWSIYLSIQARTAACKLPRTETDDAIDDAIAAMDEFILANSSLHPTPAMLDDFKRRNLSNLDRFPSKSHCQDRLITVFRNKPADEIRAATKAFLAVPREPVMNPCL